MDRPNSIEYAKNLTIINLFNVNLRMLLLYPSIIDVPEFFYSLFGTLINIFLCYKFYNGKRWASIIFTILSIIDFLFSLSGIKILYMIDNSYSTTLSLSSFLSAILSLSIIYYLNIKESRYFFKLNKSDNILPDIKTNNNKNVYNYTFNVTYNTYNKNDSVINDKESITVDYKIIIICPRCGQRLKVPGDRVVIAKCPKCNLEFNTNL